MAVADHTGQAWFQGFNDVGKVIFNMTADELIELKVRMERTFGSRTSADVVLPQDRDESAFNKVLEGAVGSMYNFTCRAKMETFMVRVTSPWTAPWR